MEIYDNVLNQSKFYETVFMKIVTATEYPDMDTFQEKDLDKYLIWMERAQKNNDFYFEEVYDGEYSVVLGATFCTVSNRDKNLERHFLSFYDNHLNEKQTLINIFDTLNSIPFKDGNICGHNISRYDIPILIKRAIKHELKIPKILIKAINSKPWESNVVDTMQLWKFGGNSYVGINEIATSMDLKYKDLPMSIEDLSLKYWKEGNKVDWIEHQTMNTVNLVLQLYRKLHNM